MGSPWEGMFEDIFGPRLPKGMKYGGRAHYAWDMKRARRYLKERLKKDQEKLNALQEAVGLIEGLLAKDGERFEEWQTRILAEQKARSDGFDARRQAERERREERLRLIAEYRETGSAPAPAFQPASVTDLKERVAAAQGVHDSMSRNIMGSFSRLFWVRGLEPLEECGWCRGEREHLSRLCLKHAWQEIEPRLGTCDVCGREYIRSRGTGVTELFTDDERAEHKGYVILGKGGYQDKYYVARRPQYCDDICRDVADNDRRRAARAENRNGLTCEVCGEVIDAPRKDARYCSSACRQKAYRARKSG